MATHQTVTLVGPDDRELDVPRTHPLRYHLTLPDGPARGLVHLIPGFGEDNDPGYATHLRSHIADRHGLAAVSVDYHACGCRVDGGARIDFLPEDARVFASYVAALGVVVEDDLKTTLENMQRVLSRLPERRELALTADLVPASGEHQNFGVLQALDHLTVHGDLLRRVVFDRSLVIAFGSSHGAYIGHLMARFAPNTITAVFDNSGYASPALPYFLGREIGAKPVAMRMTRDITIIGFPYTRWTLHPGRPDTYGGEAHRIRDLLEPAHRAAQAGQGDRRTRYRCVHSQEDHDVAPVDDKRAWAEAMRAAGFDVELTVMGPADVDGRYVKTLDHGLGLSLKTMFDRLVGTITPATGPDDFARASCIRYAGNPRTYRFDFHANGVALTLEHAAQPQPALA